MQNDLANMWRNCLNFQSHKEKGLLNLKKDGCRVICRLIVLVICIWLFAILMMHSSFGVDGGRIAQMPKQYMLTGNYATTWPNVTTFDVAITTGHTIGLPVAWFMKLFGVNFWTITIVSGLYLVLWLIFSYELIYRLIKDIINYNDGNPHQEKQVHITSLVVWLIAWIAMNSGNWPATDYMDELNGENAALFFLTCSLLCLYKYFKERRKPFLLWCGFFLAPAIITRLVVLFFAIIMVISVSIIEIFNDRKWSSFFVITGGFGIGFVVVDLFKFQQLHYSIGRYIEWWKNSLIFHMSAQNSDNGADTLISRMTRFELAEGLTPVIGTIAVVVTLGLLIYLLYMGCLKKRWILPKTCVVFGLGGISYIIFNLIFSNGGGIATRRLIVHYWFYVLFILLSAVEVFAEGYGMGGRWDDKKVRFIVFSLFAVINAIALLPRIFTSKSLIRSFYTPGENRKCQEEMLKVVLDLPTNAKDVTYDWRIAFGITTLADIPIIFAQDVDFDSEDADAYYHICYDYLVDEIYEDFEYEVIWQKNKDSMSPSIVKLTGRKQ